MWIEYWTNKGKFTENKAEYYLKTHYTLEMKIFTVLKMLFYSVEPVLIVSSLKAKPE